MDKNKGVNASVKKDKVDGAGLTKKERRALKVQEKNPKALTNSISNNVGGVATSEATKEAKLNEKELRKLEWEKKLAEQKAVKINKPEDESLSKAQLRIKRREQQEAQRLAKQELTTKPEVKISEKPQETVNKISSNKPGKHQTNKKTSKQVRKLQIVSHLYSQTLYDNTIVNYKNVHPVFVKLGVQYATKKILGSNARCLALLTAVKYLINDLQTPPKQEFCRYLETVLQNCVAYLSNCRPFAVSMNNALRHFKTKLQKAEIEGGMTKESLVANIDTYITEEIDKAGEAISIKVNEKIYDNDVILIYGCSSLIKKILLDAHRQNKQFEVIIVDGRPFLEGRQMLQRLVQVGIHCSYVQINAISYVMNLATKVLLGAHALLTNGYVMSRIGTAQVAIVAQAYNKPVLVCCETYKFSERVQTDSFVYNELGAEEMLTSADTLEETSPLTTGKNDANLQILNLLYDVTPPDLITAVVTELAILPCTSAPVVLRVKPTDFV